MKFPDWLLIQHVHQNASTWETFLKSATLNLESFVIVLDFCCNISLVVCMLHFTPMMCRIAAKASEEMDGAKGMQVYRECLSDTTP